MHPSDLHRVRVLAPATGAEHLAAPSPQLSRQATLFEKYRQLAADQQAAANASHEAAPQAGDAPASRAEAALHEGHARVLYGPHTTRHGGATPTPLASPGAVAALADALERDAPQEGENKEGQQDESGNDRQEGQNGDKNGNGGGEPPMAAPSSTGLGAAPAASPSTGSAASRGAGTGTSQGTRSSTGPSAGSSLRPGAGSVTVPGTLATQDIASAVMASPHMTAIVPAASVAATGEAPPLVDYLLSQAAEFCSNPAVLAHGNWQLTIALDPRQLPDCNLHLSLSYFDLTLRFETGHPTSRQLISAHTATLHERLDGLLKQAAPNAPRNIEITAS